MFNQNMFIHKNSPMLIVRNHTFLFLGGIVKTTNMKNKMANNTTHDLKPNMIMLITIIHHKKMLGKKHVVTYPCLLIQGHLSF
jgi:hypothetical protein